MTEEKSNLRVVIWHSDMLIEFRDTVQQVVQVVDNGMGPPMSYRVCFLQSPLGQEKDVPRLIFFEDFHSTVRCLVQCLNDQCEKALRLVRSEAVSDLLVIAVKFLLAEWPVKGVVHSVHRMQRS